MGSMFGGGAPTPPEPKPPAPMPDPESPAVKEAKRQSMLNAMQRRGRQDTIITNATLGAGNPYADTSAPRSFSPPNAGTLAYSRSSTGGK